MNSSVWSAIDHMRKEESLAMSRWREDTMTVEQRPATVEDNGNSRNIAQRHKVAKLKNVCSQYGNFTAGQRTEYLRMISSILEN